MKPAGMSSEAGFSLVEMLIAVVIFAVGALGLAGTSAFQTRQTTIANLHGERAAALIHGVETLKSMDFDSVAAGSDSVGRFAVEWTILSADSRSALTEIVTVGPGLTTAGGGAPKLGSSVPDTFTYRLIPR